MQDPINSADPTSDPSDQRRQGDPDGEAIRILAGQPLYTLPEVQEGLAVSADHFIEAWDGKQCLSAAARVRLLALLVRAQHRLKEAEDRLVESIRKESR